MIALPFIILALSPSSAFGQTIYSVAGGGTDDGLPATEASLLFPHNVAADSRGDLIINDSDRFRVRRVDAVTGVITTFAGTGRGARTGNGGPADEAAIFENYATAIDAEDNVFIAGGFGEIYRIDGRTGVISTYGGSGSSVLDDIPATQALLGFVQSLSVDAVGNLYIADSSHHRVRVISVATGRISTIAGNGSAGYSGDGGPAKQAELNSPLGVFVQNDGDVFVADSQNHVIRRIHEGVITTIAGTGTAGFSGDFGPATAARMNFPNGIDGDQAGTIYFSDTGNRRVRRIASGEIRTVAVQFSDPKGLDYAFGRVLVADKHDHRIKAIDLDTGIVTAVAGNGQAGIIGDGLTASAVEVMEPLDVKLGPDGHLYYSDSRGLIRRLDLTSGIVLTVAGGGNDARDDVAALDASIAVTDISFGPDGDLYFTEFANNRIRKLDMKSRRVLTMAGTGQRGSSGDGGPALQATVDLPVGIVVAENGEIFFSEEGSNRVRKISGGIVTAVAGQTGVQRSSGDGGPPASAELDRPFGLALDSQQRLYIAENGSGRVRVVDFQANRIDTYHQHTAAELAFDSDDRLYVSSYDVVFAIEPGTRARTMIAGGNGIHSIGDNGPALNASFAFSRGIAAGADGTLYVADALGNRIRGISGCVPAATPDALSSSLSGSSAALSWAQPPGVFSYDVFLDTANPPIRRIATGVSARLFAPIQSYAVGNLEPNQNYYWRIRANGDPYCLRLTFADSAISTFSTSGCASPAAPVLGGPADGAAVAGAMVTLSWGATPGAGSYEVYFYPSGGKPALVQTTTGTTTTISVASGASYEWHVRARASCNESLVSPPAPGRRFTVSGICSAPGQFGLNAPEPDETVRNSALLQWESSVHADSYVIYLGETTPPPLHREVSGTTELAVTGLRPSSQYYWRVEARASCSASVANSDVRSFRTGQGCEAPAAPRISFVPGSPVGTGQSYVIAWARSPELPPGGVYMVQRSSDSTFVSIQDVELLDGLAVTHVSDSAGTVFHRVRAIPPCDVNLSTPWSESMSVIVTDAKPNVVFTAQPPAEIAAIGEVLEDKQNSFTIENIGDDSVDVFITGRTVDSPNFFRLAVPDLQVRLEPRRPKTFGIRYSGVSTAQPGSYVGMIVVSAPDMAVVPSALFTLKVGAQEGASPQFVRNGLPVSYASLPGFAGSDDTDRPSHVVSVRNPGGSPLELAMEIGPEAWLVPEPGWNDSPIPPGATRDIRLKTRRSQAPSGSSLPRYTYLTVRTRGGGAARLLVQDNGAASPTDERTADPGPGGVIVPDVVRSSSAISLLRLSNLGPAAVQVEVTFTSEGVGDSGAARRASVVVPGNDVLTLIDPLGTLFGLSEARGLVVLSAADDRLNLLHVRASLVAADNVERVLAEYPFFASGEGVRKGRSLIIDGVTRDEFQLTNLVMAETSGIEEIRATVSIHDDLSLIGNANVVVPRLGQARIADVIRSVASIDELSIGTVRLTLDDGGGSLAAWAEVNHAASGYAVIRPGRVASSGDEASSREAMSTVNSAARQLAAPVVISTEDGSHPSPQFVFKTTRAGRFNITFRPADGSSTTQSVSFPGPGRRMYRDVLKELFGVTNVRGALFIDAPEGGVVLAGYSGSGEGLAGPLVDLPLISRQSTSVTGGTMAGVPVRRTLLLDGLQQSSLERGVEWSLTLAELVGGSSVLSVRVYEAGNRATHLIERRISIGSYGLVELAPLFEELGLVAESRNRDRNDLLITVTSVAGSGLVGVVATSVERDSQARRYHLLRPLAADSALGRDLAGQIPTSPPRRRPVRR